MRRVCPTPNYEYRGGLTTDVVSFTGGGELWAESVTVTEDQTLRPLPRDRMDEIESALSNPDRVTLRDGETAINGQCAVIDPTKPNGQTEYIWPQWGVPLGSEIFVDYMLGRVAVDPGTQYVGIQLPGIGDADILPRAMRQELRKTGRFAVVGGLYANLPDTDADTKIYQGTSLGGRFAIAAGASDERSNYVIVADPPGSQRLGLAGIAKAFMVRENRHSQQYISTGEVFDPETVKRQREYDKITKFIAGLFRDHPVFKFVTTPWAMSHEGLLSDIELYLANPASRGLVIQSPTMSELNNSDTVRNWVGPNHGTKLSVITLDRHTHSFGQAHPIAAAMAHDVAKRTLSIS